MSIPYPSALLIDGALRPGGGASRPVINPASEQTLADVPDASAGDVSDALSAAAHAWPDWGEAPPNERARVLRKIAARRPSSRGTSRRRWSRGRSPRQSAPGTPSCSRRTRTRLRVGGSRLIGGAYAHGYWMASTVLTDVTESMPAMTDELFGPVTPIFSFRDWPDVRDRPMTPVTAFLYMSTPPTWAAPCGLPRAVVWRGVHQPGRA